MGNKKNEIKKIADVKVGIVEFKPQQSDFISRK